MNKIRSWPSTNKLATLFFLLGASIALGAAPQAAPSLRDVRSRLQAGQPTRIVCFGDSITGTYYHTGSRRAWCDVLGIALRQAIPNAQPEMTNAGISGHTTVNALQRIDHDVLRYQPHLVVVMFGMNDVTRVPTEQYRANLRTIVNRCRETGAVVILCTPNSVIENTARPNARLSEYSAMVRDVARELGSELVGVFADWQTVRERDEQAWRLWMSDEIHPNMNGHRRFAELIAGAIAGREVRLADLPPPADSLQNVWSRLERNEPVQLVAMPPYGELVQSALRRHFPQAEIKTTEWPAAAGTDLAQLRHWGQQVRSLKPDLVVPAVPASAQAPDVDSFIRDYEWILNWSFPFEGDAWDVVPILALDKELSARQREDLRLARTLAIGKDVAFIERGPNDPRAPGEIVSDWFDAHRPNSGNTKAK